MAASDARPMPRKNTAFRVTFPIYDSSGDLKTGASGLDSEVSIDGGTFADCTNEATEIATSSGIYYLDLTSGEMNGDTVALNVKSTSNKTTTIVIYPEELGDIRVDVGQISGDATAADNAESFFDGTGYAGTNNVIPTVATVTNVTTVNGLASGVITATSIAADAITAAKIADGAIDAATFAAGAINAAAIAADAITDAKVASDVTIASVTGAVGSVTSGVTVTTNNDKSGYALSNAGVQAIWDALTSALTTAGSIGKLLVDNINATISSRLASASYSAPPSAAAIRAEMDTNSTQLAKLGTPAGASVSADIAAVKVDTAAILDDTGTSGVVVASGSKTGYSLASDQSSVTVGTVNDLGTTARGRVNAEVLDVLNVDTFAEPSSVPAATSTLVAKLQWLFAIARNKLTQNATTQTLRNDADSANIATSTIADDGTTMTRGEWS